MSVYCNANKNLNLKYKKYALLNWKNKISYYIFKYLKHRRIFWSFRSAYQFNTTKFITFKKRTKNHKIKHRF